MSDIARWSWNIVSISDANGAYVSVDDHRAEVERLTAERDAALAEVERLTNERDKARANGQAILNSSRPDDDHRAMVRRLTAERDAAEEIGRRILALMGEGR